MSSSDPLASSSPELLRSRRESRTATDIPSVPSSAPVEPIEDNGGLDDVRVAAALKIQRLFRCRHARKHLYTLLATVFEKFYDEDSGLYYYYNKKTGETTWEKPKVLKQHEDIALSSIYGEAGGNADSDFALEEDETKLVDVEEQQPNSDHLQPETVGEDGEGEESDDDDDAEADEGDEGEGENQNNSDGKDALGFTAKERELVRQQFDYYDADHSGSISAPELLKLLTSLGEQLTLKNVQDMIKEVDKNANGEVEFEEFLMILKKQKGRNQYAASLELAILFGPKELDNLKRQFIKLDLDGSGSIDEHEIQVLIKKLGKKVEEYDLKAMLLEVDEDGSGAIGFNEFLKIIANMMKDNGGLKRSGFAALLDLGIAQGLLNELGDVVKLSQAKLYEWWNANMIAEQKRLEAKRERHRKQEEERRRQQEKDEAAYREHQTKLDAVEAARRAPIDGLVHEILFAGDDLNFPNIGQYARVHYVGMFEKTGKIFENTRKRGGALEFCVGVGHIIKGFDLVLQRMSIGETAKVTMAPMLAYGVKGRPPRIPPNATLVFKIELISIKEKLNFARDGFGDDDDD
uniref:peptidylprolyl isomerase n=1 Tax=Globisporangium ultimum (strain ATCC 200006 / CBS 805.95 / DAOM BR144) TaxID=431595 RepID=K3XC19_GLOUD